MKLADLIFDTRSALSNFDYDHYPRAFAAFSAELERCFSPDPDPDELLDALDAKRASIGRRESRAFLLQDRQVMALFFAPACRKLGGAFQEYSELLNVLWAERYPKYRYLLGSYEAIMKGFDANLLGLPLRKSLRRGKSSDAP